MIPMSNGGTGYATAAPVAGFSSNLWPYLGPCLTLFFPQNDYEYLICDITWVHVLSLIHMPSMYKLMTTLVAVLVPKLWHRCQSCGTGAKVKGQCQYFNQGGTGASNMALMPQLWHWCHNGCTSAVNWASYMIYRQFTFIFYIIWHANTFLSVLTFFI